MSNKNIRPPKGYFGPVLWPAPKPVNVNGPPVSAIISPAAVFSSRSLRLGTPRFTLITISLPTPSFASIIPLTTPFSVRYTRSPRSGRLRCEGDEDFVALSEAYPTHFGSHPNYDIQIKNQIDDVLRANNLTTSSNLSNLSDQQIMNMIEDVEDLSLNVLENWVPSKLN